MANPEQHGELTARAVSISKIRAVVMPLEMDPDMGAMTDAHANAVLDKDFRSVNYDTGTPLVSLHSADPGNGGSNELTGGGYSRQTPSFAAAAARAIETDDPLEFDTDGTPVTHVGIWFDSALKWKGAVDETKSGDIIRIPAGDLVASLPD